MNIDTEKFEHKYIVWTETSENSKLNEIKELIEKNIEIEWVSDLKELIEKQKYKELQTILWLNWKNVDGKLWKFTLEKLYEYMLRQDTRWESLNALTDKSDLKSIVWTETSKNSALAEIKGFLESKLPNDFLQDLYDLVLKKDYKWFQRKLGMVWKDCDWMLWKKTLRILQESDFPGNNWGSEEDRLTQEDTLIKKETQTGDQVPREGNRQETKTSVIEPDGPKRKSIWKRLFDYDSTPVWEEQTERDKKWNVVWEWYYDKRWKKTGVRKIFKTEYGVKYTYEITYKKWKPDGVCRKRDPNGELLQEWNLKDWLKVGERRCFDGGYPRIVVYNDEWKEIAVREME